jgi:hypothetical protein
MADTPSIDPLPRTPEREALGAMGGYDYQIWRSIEAWLTLDGGEVLFLEGAEDIDRINASETTTIQVKRTQDAVSLNSQRARDAIRNYWATCERSPERTIRFVYLTTSGISLERDARFGGQAGVQAWMSAAYDADLAEAIREQLLASLESDQPIRRFLETSTVEEIQERLIQRFTWLMEQPNVDVVEQSVLDRISAELAKLGQPKSAARSVKSALFEYCWKQVLKEEPTERKLDTIALQRQIEASTTVTLDMPLSTVSGLVMATAQLGSLQSNAAVLALLQDLPPAPPRALLRRLELAGEVSRLVQQRRALLLTGSVFMGKTTIAQVVAHDLDVSASWTSLTLREPPAIADIFKLLALTLDRPDGPSLLIFDDLDTSPIARRAYESSLRQLVHRAEVAGKSLLFTAQGHTDTLEREVASLWGLEVIQVPRMSQEEIAIQCADFGCTSAINVDTWSRVINLQTRGHPALVHVRMLELSANGWPSVTLTTFTDQSEAARTAKQIARELLGSSVGPAETEFALEAAEFSFPPTRAMLLNLAGLPPPLPGASTVLTNLTGRWIEQLGGDRFRVTQILKGEVGVTWTPEQYRTVHEKLYDAIIASDPLTPADAGGLIFHAFLAMDARRLQHSIAVVLGAEDEAKQEILKYCSWILPVETDATPERSPLVSVWPSLLHLQFLVAEVEEPSRLVSVAKAWKRAIGPWQAGRQWMASSMVYKLTILSKYDTFSIEVVLDALTSVIAAEEPFRSVLLQGLAAVKSSMELGFLAPPESATTFQTLFSLRAGGVKTQQDLSHLVMWLGQPENQELAVEFDQMLDWPSVIELGAFIHTAWVAEANTDSPNWAPWLECFDQAMEVCALVSLPRYGAQVARAKSIVLSEYLEDMEGGYAALDAAVNTFGPSAVIEDQRVNLLGRSGNHIESLEAWDRLLERFGHSAISDPFAYRRAAISAGKLELFNRAAQLFEAGAQLLKDDMYPTKVGLLVDASFCSLRAGNRRKCSALMASAVLLLPIQASAEGDRQWEAIIQVGNAVMHISEGSLRQRPDSAPVEIAIGRASDPSVATDVAQEGQASRVELLQAQVAYLEARWSDASLPVLERAQLLRRSDNPMVRLVACQALILRDATQGTSLAFIAYVRELAEAMASISRLRRIEGVPDSPRTVEETHLGLLVLGVLLVRSESLELLAIWANEAHAANDNALHDVLERLYRGMSMGSEEAAIESATFESRDRALNFGAALRVCRGDDVIAIELVVASLRIASALKSGYALFLEPFLHQPVAQMLAGRLRPQLRMATQFSMPSFAIPALDQTIRQVIAGDAGIRELLSAGCRVTGVNPGGALQQI